MPTTLGYCDDVPYLTCGDARLDAIAGPSLVVTRNLSKTMGLQTLVAPKVLQGLLPAALLDSYEFWQNKDDSITAYMRGAAQQGLGQPSARLSFCWRPLSAPIETPAKRQRGGAAEMTVAPDGQARGQAVDGLD